MEVEHAAERQIAVAVFDRTRSSIGQIGRRARGVELIIVRAAGGDWLTSPRP